MQTGNNAFFFFALFAGVFFLLGAVSFRLKGGNIRRVYGRESRGFIVKAAAHGRIGIPQHTGRLGAGKGFHTGF